MQADFTETETGPVAKCTTASDHNPLLIGNDTLTVSSAAQFSKAVRPGQPRVRIAPNVEDRLARSVALKHELIATRQPIYGVTTGFGDSAIRQISPAKATALQSNLIDYHLNGSGPTASREVVRATLLVRANCLARGYSGVRREVIQRLIDMLDHDVLPIIPERGSVGASGDLVPLCYLANVVKGHGEVLWGSEIRSAQEVLHELGLEPIVLEAKEALALINGTSFMSGFAIHATHDANELAVVADVCTALTAEALRGNRGHFDALIHQQKPHPGQIRSAARIHLLLEGSGLSREYAQVLEANPQLGDHGFLKLDRAIQDRYSLRCAPHVTGVLYDTLAWATRWVEVEINSTNDNPLFDPDSASVYSGGNFYGGHIGQSMDAMKLAVASVADLLDRQLALVVDEKFNHGLTPNLIPRFEDDAFEAGLHHGFKGVQLACSSLVAEALKLTNPATAFSRSTEAHNQDKVSMGTIAARDARTIVELTQNVAAIHLIALCQAVDLRGSDKLGIGTRTVYDLIRRHVPFLSRDRRLDHDINAVVSLIRSNAISAAIAPVLDEADAFIA